MFAPLRVTTLLAMLLAAVLVLTQTLGVIHGITHGLLVSSMNSHDHRHDHNHNHDHDHDHDHNHNHDHDHDHDNAEASAADKSHFLTALFSSHQEVSDCRLYDQANHSGLLPQVVALALPVVLPPFGVAIFQGEALARWAALFDARGPPLTV